MLLLDRDQLRNTTKYPFSSSAKLTIMQHTFPYQDILSIRIQVPQFSIVYISAITLYKDFIRLHFSGLSQMHSDIFYESNQSYIFDQKNAISGVVFYKKYFHTSLSSLILAIGTDHLQSISSQCLQLASSCITVFKPPRVQNFQIVPGVTINRDTTLHFAGNTQYQLTKDASDNLTAQINVYGDFSYQYLPMYKPAIQAIAVVSKVADAPSDDSSDDPFTNSLYQCSLYKTDNTSISLIHQPLSDLRVITNVSNNNIAIQSSKQKDQIAITEVNI